MDDQPTQGARDSNSYGSQRSEDYGHKIATPNKTRVTRADVMKRLKKKKGRK